MKKIACLFSFLFLFTAWNVHAQARVSNLEILPVKPIAGDFIKFSAKITTPSLGHEIYRAGSRKDDTVFVDVCYFTGPLAEQDEYLDTFNIGVLKEGNYVLFIKVYTSDSAESCNVRSTVVHTSNFTVDKVNGLVDLTKPSNGLSIAPNPAAQNFTVFGRDFEKVVVINSLGQTIYEEKLNPLNDKHELPSDKFPMGTYVVMATMVNGKQLSVKLLK